MITRRDWLGAVAIGGVGSAVLNRLEAQQQSQARTDTTNLFAMDQAAARTVGLAPKKNAQPSMSADTRDALEHRIRCQCGCTLDVFTCRTTDFSCQVSPAMHRDIMALVAGGYDEREILDAFVRVYGDQALMAPPKVGFNIVGYVLPGIAIALGGVVLAVIIRGMGRAGGPVAPAGQGIDASPDELARLDKAVRDDS